MRSSVLLVLLALAAPARAQVAVAYTLPDGNPTHRDVAAGVVSAVEKEWLMLRPQLHPDVMAECRADVPCLLRHANELRASHLLVVGVAGIGIRDYVVSLQVYDARGTRLLDENAVRTAGPDPRADGAALGRMLKSVPGIPFAPPAPPAAVGPPGPSTLTIVGVGLVGGGAAVGLLSAAAAMARAQHPDAAGDRDAIVGSAALGATAAVLMSGAGVACVVADGL